MPPSQSVCPGQVWQRRNGRNQGAQMEVLYEVEVSEEFAPRRWWVARALTDQQGAKYEYEEAVLVSDWRLL